MGAMAQMSWNHSHSHHPLTSRKNTWGLNSMRRIMFWSLDVDVFFCVFRFSAGCEVCSPSPGGWWCVYIYIYTWRFCLKHVVQWYTHPQSFRTGTIKMMASKFGISFFSGSEFVQVPGWTSGVENPYGKDSVNKGRLLGAGEIWYM